MKRMVRGILMVVVLSVVVLPLQAAPYSSYLVVADVPPHAGLIPLDLKDVTDYETVIYIDPDTSAPGDGSSPDAPLAGWGDVNFQENTAYVQKRGTTANIASAIGVGRDNVLLGAYGDASEPRPIIMDVSTDIRYMLQLQNDGITVRDLEIVSPQATSGIHFAAGYWPSDGVVWNCSVHGVDQDNYMMWGIRIFGARTKVLHTEIAYIGDDAIFVQYFPDVEIGYSHIHHVNQKWFEDTSEGHAGGDGIQYDASDRFYIHHNTIDRSDTGNKFCVIVDPKGDNAAGGLIENNVCFTRSPIPVFAGGATPYHIVVRNNYFEDVTLDGGSVGVYSHATQPEIYNNVFVGFGRAITLLNSSGAAEVHHNVFYGTFYNGVWGDIASLNATNNIFALNEGAQALSVSNFMASHNLFTREEQAAGDNAVLGDPQFVDAAGSDFRLLVSSPARDAGLAVPGLDTDAAGNAHVGPPDIGAYEFQPEVQLFGRGGDQTLYLNWNVNATLPTTATWQINYQSDGTVYLPIAGIISTTRAYSLTNLVNYTYYTVTLYAAQDSTTLFSDTVRLMPTDRQVYLPLVVSCFLFFTSCLMVNLFGKVKILVARHVWHLTKFLRPGFVLPK